MRIQSVLILSLGCILVLMSATKSSYAQPFPITAKKNTGAVSGKAFDMETKVFILSEKKMKAQTRIWTKAKMRGYTGEVGVAFFDSNGNEIWVGKWHTKGIDGCWIGDCDVTFDWDEVVS